MFPPPLPSDGVRSISPFPPAQSGGSCFCGEPTAPLRSPDSGVLARCHADVLREPDLCSTIMAWMVGGVGGDKSPLLAEKP